MRKFFVTVLFQAGRNSYLVRAASSSGAASWAMGLAHDAGLDPVRVFSVVEV